MASQTNHKNLNIVVVDDSSTIRTAAESMLREYGYKIALAENGYEALSLIVDNRPDIIFMDILMPKLDGYQTCALIKHNIQYKDIPIIMLSSKDGVYDKAKARVVGANDYITKPFTMHDLMAAIKNHVTLNTENTQENNEQ
jgi:twitching motility two-component system response regulator PilG